MMTTQDIEMNELCNVFANTTLHLKIEEVKMDLLEILCLRDSFNNIQTSNLLINQYSDKLYRFAENLHYKHVYYNRNISLSEVDILADESFLITSLRELAEDNWEADGVFNYIEKTKRFYVRLLDYLERD